jgi:hypothetical protein
VKVIYLHAIQRVTDVRQIQAHTAEPLVHDPSSFEVEIAIATLKMEIAKF